MVQGGGNVDDVKVNGTSVLDEDKIANIELKTINGDSITGEGNVAITTYQPFNSAWVTNSTTKAFCDSVNVDDNAVEGMAYLGELTCSDLPFNGNGDAVVEIMNGPGGKKTIHVILTSGDTFPYRWEYTYWNDGQNLSDWIDFKVEANPSMPSGTTPTNLTGLRTGNGYFSIAQPIDVVANPTLVGTESNLTGLQVGSTKYKVPTFEVTDNTTSAFITLDATAFTNLKTNHYATLSSLSSLPAGDFIRIKVSLNSTNYNVVLTKNDTNNYTGTLTILSDSAYYELVFTILSSGSGIIRCATVYEVEE